MTPARRSAEATRDLRASLVAAAQRLVEREGPAALTMRALAAEAGCAVGLPYKVFTSREQLVAELVHAEYERIRAGFDALVAGAGRASVAENLWRYAEILLGSPAVGLAREVAHDTQLAASLNEQAREVGLVAALETTVADYLAAEKRIGRVAADVDEQAFGFVIAGAVHNLLVSGEAYPQPPMDRLRQMLAAVAERLSPPGWSGPGAPSQPAADPARPPHPPRPEEGPHDHTR